MSWAPLLLADRSPCLRMQVLRELLGRSTEDGEVQELLALRDSDPLVAEVMHSQNSDGSWQSNDPAMRGDTIQVTARTLSRLGYLGLEHTHPAVVHGVEYLFTRQRKDGSWPLPANREAKEEGGVGYSMMPLQTALPLRGLAACGYATDPRAEKAYEWLLTKRLSDGAWPTGIAAGNYGYVAGYRRLAHSRWGCRSNTTGALICLSLHPQRRMGQEAQRGLDLLLGRETREQYTLGSEVARLLGAEPARGFITYYARFDPSLILDLCWRIGATTEDQRVAELVAFIQELRGAYGLWEYHAHPEVSRWVTFDLLRSLGRLDETGDWLTIEPRTPFRAYPKKPKRY